jgi:hypothetical protein
MSPVTSLMTVDTGFNCKNCYYEHPDPSSDPFYQDQVKTLMYCCAVILLLVSHYTSRLTLVIPDRTVVFATNTRFADLAEPTAAHEER